METSGRIRYLKMQEKTENYQGKLLLVSWGDKRKPGSGSHPVEWSTWSHLVLNSSPDTMHPHPGSVPPSTTHTAVGHVCSIKYPKSSMYLQVWGNTHFYSKNKWE